MFMKSNHDRKPHGFLRPTLFVIILITGLWAFPQYCAGREISFSSIQTRQMDTSVENFREWLENLRQLKGVLLESAEHLVFQHTAPHWLKRLGILLSIMAVNTKINLASALTLSEVGVAEAAHHYGANPFFGFWLGSDKKTDLNAVDLFWEILISRYPIVDLSNIGFYTVYWYWGRTDFSLFERTSITIAKINTNTIYARDLCRGFTLSHQYSIVDSGDYLVNKFFGASIFMMSFFDFPLYYVSELKQQGVDTSKEEIFRYKAAAALLSGGVFNAVRSYWTYLRTGKPEIEPFTLRIHGYRWYWPEQMVYLNTDNVSYSVETMVEHAPQAFITVGYETPIIGVGKPGELLLGYDRQIKDWTIHTQAVINQHGHYFLTGELAKKIHPYVAIFAKGYYGDQGTQRQQREWIDSRGIIMIGVKCFL
jgi:hypothetical protein